MKIKHLNVTAPDYFGVPFLSNSTIKGGVMKASVATLRTGQLFHLNVYEPPLFDASEEAKAHDLQKTSTGIRTGVENSKMIRLVKRMGRAARANPIVLHFLNSKKAQFEREFFCYIQVPGIKEPVPFKMKADGLLYNDEQHTTCLALQDLKSTSCRTLAEFLAVFEPYGYWSQAYLYKLITGAKNFYFIGVTKSEPHQTFTVNTKYYRAEMKAAKMAFPQRVKDFLAANPDYRERAASYFTK